MNIREFMNTHFKHFNARETLEAANGYECHLRGGGKMLVSIAGAMSTAEIGRSLAKMIRAGMVDAISCTGANLEEDVFNLIAREGYKRVDDYRSLSATDEKKLADDGFNRVTDVCIPESLAFGRVAELMIPMWEIDEALGVRRFPHEYFYEMLLSTELDIECDADPNDSWMLAAAKANLPLYVPGWEDSTIGNMFAAHVILGKVDSGVVKNGIEYMVELADWYAQKSEEGVGFFQIGGGIAGDFPICVVPMIRQDLGGDVQMWKYFCQISDSTTSYGSYSGAVPNEKITWGKLEVSTPKYMIESDATIVVPLIFEYILQGRRSDGQHA